MNPSLRGMRVVVTGASGGLGVHVVEAFLAVGSAVVGVGRRRTALDELRAQLRQHERLDVAECDVSQPTGVEALFESLERKAPIDAVVHTVGGFMVGPLREVDPEVARDLVQTNFLSTLFTLKAALRRMEPRGRGSFVAIASDRALYPAAEVGVYGATKAAVTHLVQAAAHETRASGVRVNAILPGTMDTAPNRRAMPDADPAFWTSPSAVARTAVYLAASETSAHGALVTVR